MAETSFALQIGRWSENARRKAEVVCRKIALDMTTRVIMRSPVDTGRFRGNWQTAIGVVPGGTTERKDKLPRGAPGGRAFAQAQRTSLQFGPGQIIYLVNNLPYAVALEHGWSKQAPAGMVKITVQEFGPIVESLARA